MTGKSQPVQVVEADVLDRMNETNALIAQRAYEIFESRGGAHGSDRDDWFGAVDDDIVPRIGDVLAVAKPGHSLLADFDRRTGHLRGQHGSLTAEEVAVPLLTVRA